MKNTWLIYMGVLTPLMFWTTNIICGIIMGNYNHSTRLVSELGEIGTKSQYFFSVGIILSSFFSLLFVIGLYKTAKQIGLNTIPILLILTFSFSMCGIALFPLPLKLHGILGLPSLFLILSPILSLILWKNKKISRLNYFSLLAFIIMLLGFSVLLPNFLDEYFGIKQRFFHLGWTIWFIYLSVTFIELNKKIEPNH